MSRLWCLRDLIEYAVPHVSDTTIVFLEGGFIQKIVQYLERSSVKGQQRNGRGLLGDIIAMTMQTQASRLTRLGLAQYEETTNFLTIADLEI
jgi:hypothetical protein